MPKLLDLIAANRGRGRPLALVRDGNEVTVEVYDVIVSSDVEADFWGGVSAQTFARDLRSLTAADTAHIRINSPGGDVFGGIAMAQAIRETKAKVVAHVDGYAASAASLLVAAAAEVVMAPAAMVMIHKAWTIAMGNADDFREQASVLEKVDGELAATYRAKAGGTAGEWLQRMAAETWFTGEEAVAAGLATRLADRSDRQAQNVFDLSVYARAPRVTEPQPPAQVDDLERRRRMVQAYMPRAA